MTPTPAPPEAAGRKVRLALAAAAAALGLAGAARAAPLDLDTPEGVAAFAERVSAYGGASRVRWVVAAPTRADAEAKIAEIAGHLPPAERYLASRLAPQGAPAGADGQPAVRAWLAPQIGASAAPGACSWQVWVSDPGFPSPDEATVTVPLAPNDRLPVSPAATFRVGHSGLLQSKLYAFDETQPGEIRDLATAPDVNVPVAPTPNGELIFLAVAREAAPFLETLKGALADSQGKRRALGAEFALRRKLMGEGRGIGANIQEVPAAMILPRGQNAAPGEVRSKGGDAALMETCLYALTPAP